MGMTIYPTKLISFTPNGDLLYIPTNYRKDFLVLAAEKMIQEGRLVELIQEVTGVTSDMLSTPGFVPPPLQKKAKSPRPAKVKSATPAAQVSQVTGPKQVQAQAPMAAQVEVKPTVLAKNVNLENEECADSTLQYGVEMT